MLTIGLTGGYATGKSTVAAMLRDLGAAVADADELAHETLRRGEPAWREVLALFGPAVQRAEGEIDRGALGRLVFADPGLRIKLERIVHPKVIDRLRGLRDEAAAAGRKVFAAEVPLLFEAGMAGEFDLVWAVGAPPSLQIRLGAKRDGLTETEAAARAAAQMPLGEKERRADLVLVNDGDREHLRRQVEEAWEGLGGGGRVRQGDGEIG